MPTGDTIAAIASPPGRSPRAIVRLSGPATREILAAALDAPPRPFDRAACSARLRLGDAALPILILTYRAPSSYTGEDAAELLLPGNPTLLERTLALLTSFPGVRPANPGEFSARAYLNERLSLDQAEGVAATIAAENQDQLAAARRLLEGRTGADYRSWADELATLLALVEAGIDFTDQEDVVAIPAATLRERLAAVGSAIREFLGAAAGAELRRDLPRVVLAGRPNAGKSTLFNALLGRPRAVVSDQPGTTRDMLEEPLDLSRDVPGAGPVLLIDLAGLDEAAAGLIDRDAQARAAAAIANADVVIHCDPTGAFAPLAIRPGAPILHVRTKADLPTPHGEAAAIPICALDRWNLPILRRAIADAATGAGSAGAVLPRHRRALALALEGLSTAIAALGADQRTITDPEIVADALRTTLDALGELTGRIAPDDILGRIFATFCVGK